YQVMTAKNVDMRISIPALVLLVLALRPHWGRAQKMALTAALLLMGLHAGLIARHWTGMNRREDRVLALGAKLVPGTRIDVIEDTPGGVVTNKWDFTLPKIVDYWSVSRGTYESNVFAEAGQQPLIKRRGFSNCWPAGQAACLHNFDYIVTVNAPQPLARGVRAIATPVAQAEGATLWRVKQGLGFGG
ncbi:MAG: hypothetical protein ACRD1F_10445, partial [Terriglobales bacterium]